VQSGAGDAANCSDDAYRAAGAEVVDGAAALWAKADIVFKVRGPSAEEVGLMREGGTLISFIWPAQNPELMQQLAAKKATVLAIDSLPRTLSRAQKMDALTSQAGVAGYRAVIEAANAFGRFFNGQITAAGKVPPAKVFIAGAGVAGLAAIGTAAGLGAIVRANDTRAEVADQVVSLGGEFVKVDYEEEGSGGGGYAKVMSEGFQQAQREMYAKQAREVDIIITTALIPGKPAPRLITAEMVKSMKPGSVIVDMAAEQGGNCELTEPGQVVVKHGVTLVGYTDLVGRLSKQSSTLYATNLFRLAEELCKTKDGDGIDVNMEDEAIRGLTVIKDGDHLAAAFPQGAAAPAGRQARGRRGARPPRATATAPARRPRAERGGHVRRRRRAVLAHRRLRAGELPRPLHGLRAGLLRRLHGGVERHAGAAHAADERDQRHFQHHRHRRAGADRAAAGRAGAVRPAG
jgi:NAD(P) transhydrogenase subunit alpha